MKRILFLTILLCLAVTRGIFAQANLQDALPADPNTLVGKLPNGITYYLRHNAEPKDRASFYIIRDAGALLEEDDQNGLAHFLEHMAFNGTKNFPGKGIITTLEKKGISFGREINAYTTQNETVYNLSNIPTMDEELLYTCLNILHDWSYYLTLNEEEIDSERGVISEEWRTRRNAQFRMQSQMFPILFKGSKYAERDVIGSLDVIKNFKPQTIRDFYHKWYRTDLEAIAIVGDFDVKRMEEMVKEVMSSVPAVKNPTPRPFYEIPEHDETYFGLVTDKEATSSSISIMSFFREPSVAEKNTHEYLRNGLIESFYNSMVATRLAELMQQANPPYMGGSFGFSGLARGYNAYAISTTAKPNEEAIALETILTEQERVLRYGFQPSELERAKTNTLVSLESSAKQQDKVKNESYIKEMQAHFLEHEPMIDFHYYHEFVKAILPTITVEDILARVKELNLEKNRCIIVQGPSEGVTHLTEAECLAIMDKVKNAEIAPYEDQAGDASLISEELKGGKIKATKELPEFEAVEWTLDNGAKVVFRKADYEKESVALYAYSKGGTSLYDVDKLPSASNAASFVGAFGLGDFDAMTLMKMMTGKMAGTKVSIGGMSESVSGSSTPQDVEEMMQMVYLRFVKPRFDEEVFKSIINRQLAALPMLMNTPQKIMQDSIQLIFSNYHPRSILVNEDYFKRIDLKEIEEIYRDRIQDASDFTFFIVGNIDEETIKPLVEKYIGSIPSTYRKETWRDNKVEGPKGKTVKKIPLKLEVPKATVITSFTKDMPYSTYNTFCNSILGAILDLRYTENIREKEGGTYGVAVQPGATREPKSSYSMVMQFDCDPDRAEHLKSLIYAELETLQREAPTAEELHKVVSNMLKGYEQSKPHNSYWMNALVGYYTTGINTTDPKNYEDILNKITPKDIQKFAKKLFKGADIVDMTFTSEAQS